LLSITVILCFAGVTGCQKKSSDINPVFTGSGGTGTGTSTETAPWTGNGTGTGSGTATGTGSSTLTGTGTSTDSGTGTGSGGTQPSVLPCFEGPFATGTNVYREDRMTDGEMSVYLSSSLQGFIKVDLRGVDTSARIATATLNIYITYGSKSGQATLYSNNIDPQVYAPDYNLWKSATNWEVELAWSTMTGPKSVAIGKPAALEEINDAIASGEGFITILMLNTGC
jgi:hypothetical protein